MSELKIILDAIGQDKGLQETLKGLREYVALLEKIDKNKKALVQSNQDQAQTAKLIAETQKLIAEKEKLENANKRLRDNEKKSLEEQTGLIGKLRKEVKDLNRQKILAKTPEELARVNRALDVTNGKLKHLSTIGKASTNTFGHALDSFAFKFNFLGNAVANFAAVAVSSIDEFVKSSVHAFLEAEENAHKLEFAVRNIAGGGSSAFQKLIEQSEKLQEISIFSDDDIQRSQTQLLQFGLTAKETEKLIPKILDLAAAQGIDLATATDKVISGINGQAKGLKDAGIVFKDAGTKTENLAIVTDKLTKFQGAAAAATETHAGKLKRLENVFDDFKEKVGEELVTLGDKVLDFYDVITGKKTAKDVGREDITEKIVGAFKKQNVLILKEAEQSEEKRLKAVAKVEDDIRKIAASGAAARTADAKKVFLSALQQQQEFLNELKNLNKEAGRTAEEDVTSGGLGKTDDRAKKNQEYWDMVSQIGKDALDAQAKATKDAIAKDKEEQEKVDKEWKERTDKNYEIFLANLERLEKDKDEQAEKDKKREKEQEELRKKRFEEFDNINKMVIAAIEERREKNLEALNEELGEQDKNIERQRELAEKGLANTLAFEERRKAEMQRAEQDEQRRLRRLKKIEAFYNSYAAYAKEDPKTALAKAAKDIALAEGISAAFAEQGGIAGEVKDRTTVTGDFASSKTHKSGDVLTVLGKREGILTEDEMARLGRDGFYSLKEMLKNPINDDLFEKQAGGLMPVVLKQQDSNKELVEEIKTLQNIVANKKELDVRWDNFGNMIRTEFENGIRKTTVRKARWA